MVPDTTESPKQTTGNASKPSTAKISAKDHSLDPSLSLGDRIQKMMVADDLDGAIALMNGILAETVEYHCRRLGITDFQDDCLQETLLRILTRWELVLKAKKIVAFIRTIAFRSVINQFRKIHRIPEDPFPKIDMDSSDPVEVEFQQELLPQPDQILMINESYSLFKKALDDVYRISPGCQESLKLYQKAQNDTVSFDVFCQKLSVNYQAMFARFRRCVEKIIDHHLFPKFNDIVSRLYPNIHRAKQRERMKEGNHHEL